MSTLVPRRQMHSQHQRITGPSFLRAIDATDNEGLGAALGLPVQSKVVHLEPDEQPGSIRIERGTADADAQAHAAEARARAAAEAEAEAKAEAEAEAREMAAALAAALAEAEAQAAREEEEEVSAAKMQALARARHARGEVHVRRQQSREQAMGGTSAAAAHGAGGSGGALPVQLRQLLAVEDRAVTYRARPALTPSELTSHQQPTPLAPPPPPPPPPVQAVPIVTGSRPSATGGLAWQQVTMTTVTTTSTTTEHAEAAEGAATAGAGAGPMAIRRPAALTVSGPPDGSSRCEGDGGSSSAGSSRAQSIVAEPTGESSWAGVGSHEASPLPRLPPHMLSPAGPPSRGRSADEFLARLREAELRDRDGAEIGRDGALASLEHRDDAGSADRTAGRAGRSGGSRKGPPPPPPQGDGSPSPST